MSGLQCEKRLWLEIWHRELKADLTASQERVFAVGTAVGEVAQERFPGGRLVQAPFYDLPGSVRETAALLDRMDVPHIYEAAFETDSTHVKVDVLSRIPDGSWHLIEVKSTTSVKPEHVTDAAVQWHVVEGAGLSVSTCSLMHLNKECRYPDLADLFTIQDISERARGVRAEVPAIIERMQAVAASATEPGIPIGTHCTKPYECPFKSHCWRAVPEQSIFTIPGLPSGTKDSLAARGVFRVIDAPAEDLSGTQAAYVEMVRRGEPVIDVPAVQAAIGALEYPLYFLDFETCANAIPMFDELGPWQNYPFQYSLHVLNGDGALTHTEYLHADETDPRSPLASALCRDVGPVGTLIAYNASFEKRVIEELAGVAPELAEELRAMIPRFFDLLFIFRRHYSHPGFLGSNSLKHVLPVLAPDLSYEGMAVASGDEAQAVWAAVISLPPENDLFGGVAKEQVLTDLREYCKLDTLAMVRIYEVLRAL
jgi:hypothetical protein